MLEVLTADELRAFSGLKLKYAIRRWLDGKKIPYVESADGWPRVLRAVILARLGGGQLVPATTREPQLRLRNR